MVSDGAMDPSSSTACPALLGGAAAGSILSQDTVPGGSEFGCEFERGHERVGRHFP